MESNYVSEVPLGHFRSAAAGFDAAALLTSITGVSPQLAKGTVLLLIQPDTQAFRWTDDGQTPTTTLGYPLASGQELRYTGRNPAALRFLSVVAGGFLNVAIYSHNKESAG